MSTYPPVGFFVRSCTIPVTWKCTTWLILHVTGAIWLLYSIYILSNICIYIYSDISCFVALRYVKSMHFRKEALAEFKFPTQEDSLNVKCFYLNVEWARCELSCVLIRPAHPPYIVYHKMFYSQISQKKKKPFFKGYIILKRKSTFLLMILQMLRY